ncbi:MAG TPA: DUF2934 domain-containing protein [Candidatus Koribacter sp.]|jgi:hypothetical protein
MPRAKSAAATAEKKSSTRIQKAAAAPTNGNSPVSVTDEVIRRRAYQLYESRGRQDGAHDADWFAAEAELRRRTA